MLPRMLPKDSFGRFVEYLMADSRVAAPVAKGPQFAFDVIASPRRIDRMRMNYDITILPPKKYLMPQHETLLTFAGPDPADEEPLVQSEPTVILGVHPYDLHGIATTDAAFSQAPADANYLARRAATRLVGINIDGYVDDHQFMADMGTLEPPEGGFDLFLTDLGESYYVETGTPAGSSMAAGSGVMRQAGPDDHKAKQDFDARKASRFTKRLPYNVRYLPEMLDSNYDSLLWDAIARQCFSCGTCTIVCPTCYCFDVQDKLNLDAAGGRRERVWDSCQLKAFAEVAGGENFREHRAGRFRHRIFRKGKYIAQRTGKLGCVGCGRCSRHCVANISILETLQQIAEEPVELEA